MAGKSIEHRRLLPVINQFLKWFHANLKSLASAIYLTASVSGLINNTLLQISAAALSPQDRMRDSRACNPLCREKVTINRFAAIIALPRSVLPLIRSGGGKLCSTSLISMVSLRRPHSQHHD